jgi:hypothetical protein
MAAWEFAAGRFPNLFSTLFCLPLVGLGALTTPRRSLAAFVRGRGSVTLYGLPLTGDLMALPVADLRRRVLPGSQPAATFRDVVAYAALAALSIVLMAAPLAALSGFCLAHG